VADALTNIDFVMPFGSSQDVPGQACDIYEFPAVVANTTKPMVFIGYSGRGVELVYEMAAAVAGGLEHLQERPFVMAYPEPITPFVYPEHVVDRLFAAADLNMPQIPGASVMLGASGPVTIAGATVQALAESLMCLTLAQLRRPGCPVALSTNMGIMDMNLGLSVFGAPTKSTAVCVHAEVAQSFGLPTWGLAGATDSKMLDAQAGTEATFHIMAQALAGLNLIHDVGYIDSAMTCSAEQLVFGNEVVGMVKQFMKGIPVNRETLAREVIESVGPGGHYLTQKHTLDHFRDVFWKPGLMNRMTREQWVEAGSKDMAEVVKEKTLAVMETHQPEPLDGKVIDELTRIRKRGEKELL
jgi:trimethylamine--corrinoid protein Co-methyltransferase